MIHVIYISIIVFLCMFSSLHELCKGEIGGKIPEKILWYEFIWLLAANLLVMFSDVLSGFHNLRHRVKFRL